MLERMMLDPKILTLYKSGFSLASWAKKNPPDDRLIYRSGLYHQVMKVAAVATLISPGYDVVPKVVGSHSSKSVRLPVSCFRFWPYDQVGAYAFIRDNFYNIKVVVVSDSPLYIPYHVVHTEWSQEKYDEEAERYKAYPGAKGAEHREEMVASGDDWYTEWSNGAILRKDGRIYRAGSYQSCYCEGINRLGLPDEVYKPYEEGDRGFVCEVGSYATVALMLEHIIRSLEHERFKQNQERQVA